MAALDSLEAGDIQISSVKRTSEAGGSHGIEGDGVCGGHCGGSVLVGEMITSELIKGCLDDLGYAGLLLKKVRSLGGELSPYIVLQWPCLRRQREGGERETC